MKQHDPFAPADNNIIRLAEEMAKRRTGVAQSTVDAFWYLVRLNDPDRLKAWLAARPLDAPTLLKLWRARKNGTA
jgi:hypothetical protein